MPPPPVLSQFNLRTALFGSENEFRISPRERCVKTRISIWLPQRDEGRVGEVWAHPISPSAAGTPPHPQDLHCYTNEVPGTRVYWMQIELSLHLLFIAEMGLIFPLSFSDFFLTLHVSYLLMSGSNSIRTMGWRQLCSDWSLLTLLAAPRDTLPLPPSFCIPAASGLLEKVPKLLIQNRYSFA
jgi:hypothetical protein